jgi:chemotaxis protein methyltransferase CheR
MQRENQTFEHSFVSMSGREFASLSRFIYEQCGIKMPDAKKTMLEGRLQKRLRNLGLKSFSDYTDYLFSPDGQEHELVQMIDVVTTNKTDFFREPDHFDYLRDRVLPEWCEKHANRRLQVWSAGCSTGQEPYTLAMVLHDFAGRRPGFDFQILATDISTRVLEQARKAVYSEAVLDPVPPVMKSKYLMRSKDRHSDLARIVPELRCKIKLRRLNFLDDDFGLREPMDIIFCRNVIIYFDRPTQSRLLTKFYGHLRAGGHIFMGHSETLSGLDVPLLTSVAPTVYRK